VSVNLVMAGPIESDRYLRSITEAVRSEGAANKVLITGQLSAEELRDWYGASDIVLLTTHTEGLGRVLLEAQAMRKPVVAYGAGGVHEAVEHGQTGYLVPVGDIETLAERLKQLLANKDQRDDMGNRARQRIRERFSLDALAQRHERLYSEVVSRPA
jgi:mannosyltransferase